MTDEPLIKILGLKDRAPMTPDEIRSYIEEIRERLKHGTIHADDMPWACDELIRALDESKAARDDLESVWHVANEKLGDVGMDAYEPADAMRAIIARAYEDGEHDALEARRSPEPRAARAVAEGCVESANNHDRCPLCTVLNRRAGEPRHSRHCPVAAYERAQGGG